MKLNGADTGKTITVNGTKVTTTLTDWTNNGAGFSTTDVLTFTFTDKYYTGNNTWSNDVTYTATCTVGQLQSGTTLNFTHP